MSAKDRPPKAGKTKEMPEKAARLAEALRANLARRKAQRRARASAAARDQQG